MPYKPEDKQAAAEVRRGMAARIRSGRLALGWSQENLAEAIGVGSEMLGRYERAQKFPSHLTLVRLAVALQTTTDALLGVPTSNRRTNSQAALVRALDALTPTQRAAVHAIVRELVAANGARRRG